MGAKSTPFVFQSLIWVISRVLRERFGLRMLNFSDDFAALAHVDKAREVVQKALKTISFRNESEKQNVWVASLNLEKQYGTKATKAAVDDTAETSIPNPRTQKN